MTKFLSKARRVRYKNLKIIVNKKGTKFYSNGRKLHFNEGKERNK